MLETVIKKAEVLIESLPYIKSFHSKTFVIKYGGSTMEESLKKDIIHDIILLKYIGINPVIVHGGGPEINSYLSKLNMKSEFVNGLRVTDKNVMEVVQMVLVGKVNQEIVSMLNLYGGKGVGLTGKDGNIIVAKKHLPEIIYDNNGQNERSVDLGFVGEIEKIDPKLILGLCDHGYIPVISPIGVGFDGESYNINADDVASAIACSLKAEKLIMLTDVDGIYEVAGNPSTKINSLTVTKAEQMIANNQITGGMIPKVRACIDAVTNGVKRTHIIDGKERHSILIEIFTDKGVGTMVIED
ncbi:MAG TPA: acetylglutamate kinase [Spirochaetota bacterium]|nr:acetylglutamate kinase [Spirochaetota bacterium]